ncbi:metal ABC transporter solute-binding protein, Zn/Mn family [Helicovermis profundi]|uniref:Zinc ABC transporter substrate-binding protein n=1 Tax=Helicovermis profundi TaxID=3065157 RepID=A0AAU9E564_9FIRM|nr:zinc ABC transporter substrate-binding protein [Clostridia bacterium S502]
MKKITLVSLILILILSLSACSNSPSKQNNKLNENVPTIAVAIMPEVTIVKAIAGDTLRIIPTIPLGASPANYQPKPSELEELENSKLYFSIGVASETANILPRVESMKNPPKIIYLNKLVSEKYPDRTFKNNVFFSTDSSVDSSHGDEHTGRDPHIWMSPKRYILISEIIRDNLIKLMPENKDLYNENAKKFIDKINDADLYVKEKLNNLPNKTFIIYHPALGYFADEYNLNMISIEENGKESTPKGLEKIINFAKENNIRVVFHQAEIDSSQAKLIANEIKGKTLEINPLSEDYINNLKSLADTFETSMKGN